MPKTQSYDNPRRYAPKTALEDWREENRRRATLNLPMLDPPKIDVDKLIPYGPYDPEAKWPDLIPQPYDTDDDWIRKLRRRVEGKESAFKKSLNYSRQSR